MVEPRRMQADLFAGGNRLTMADAIDLTVASLQAYGAEHPHWGIAYSGGKDSSATLTLIMHLIKSGQIAAPRSLTVYYADTRMELLPLAIAAQDVMALGTWPEGWEGNEPTADTPLDTIYRDGSVQPLMPPASPRTPMAMASWSRGR